MNHKSTTPKDSPIDIRDEIAAICNRQYDKQITIAEAVEKLESILSKAILQAQISELERLYLVFGSKDEPASLDNLFSLGKKGEVAATPIKERLEALKKQQEGKDV